MNIDLRCIVCDEELEGKIIESCVYIYPCERCLERESNQPKEEENYTCLKDQSLY